MKELEKMTKNIVAVYVPDTGDFVHCNWCEKIMLLSHGADKCPHCEEAGYLTWHEGDDATSLHELNEEEVKELGYQTQQFPQLEEKEYMEGDNEK